MMLLSSLSGSAPNAQAQKAEEPPSLQSKRVVIVEDEGITQHQIKRTLTRAGMVVVATAINGQEAVEKTLLEKPDLVLMDIQMAIMDGLEATRHILAAYPTCIILLTAYPEFEQQAYALGACGYLVKPITACSLLPQIQQALQRFYQH